MHPLHVYTIANFGSVVTSNMAAEFPIAALVFPERKATMAPGAPAAHANGPDSKQTGTEARPGGSMCPISFLL